MRNRGGMSNTRGRGGRGRGRGGRGRGRGGRGANPEANRDDLDQQLDEYMSKTKVFDSHLDSLMDES